MTTDLKSQILLVKNIKMDREYKNVLSLSENQILALCQNQNNLIASRNDYSFIRTQGSILTDFTYEDCLQANYIAFQNKDYSNKWFFAWIDDVIYNGDSNTELRYTVDEWSTWFSQITKKACFVVREHVNNDTVGLHTIDEGLNVGELECISESEDEYLKGSHWIGILTSWDPSQTDEQSKLFKGIAVYGGTVYGMNLFLFNVQRTVDEQTFFDFSNVVNFLWKTAIDNHIENVESVFWVSNVIPTLADVIYKTVSFDVAGVTYTSNYIGLQGFIENYAYERTINKEQSNISGKYQIKNNKCFTFPYNFLRVTNNLGSSENYRYEFSSDSQMKFETEFTCTIGGSSRIYPKNYNGIANNVDLQVPLGKLPTCGWSSDTFINWLTSEAVEQGAGIGGKIASKLGEMVWGEGVNSEISSEGIKQVIGKFANTFLKDFVGTEGNSQGTADINFTSGNTTFKFERLRCKDEYMKQIDSFFQMFGYKINEIKIPNTTGRQNFNYVEISENSCIGYGSIPPKAMDTINGACRRGVTIWHNHANLGDYSVSNNIVT